MRSIVIIESEASTQPDCIFKLYQNQPKHRLISCSTAMYYSVSIGKVGYRVAEEVKAAEGVFLKPLLP